MRERKIVIEWNKKKKKSQNIMINYERGSIQLKHKTQVRLIRERKGKC